MRPSNNLKNKIPLDTYCRVQVVCMKVQPHSSLEPTLKLYQDQMPLISPGLSWPLQPSSELQKYYADSD